MPLGGGTLQDPNAVEQGSAAGGDLSGTYPNPSIGNLKVLTQHIGNGQVTPGKLAAGLTGLYLLFDSTLVADSAAGFDTGANGIAQTADNLIVYLTARTDEAVVVSSCIVRVNNDSGANYDLQTIDDTNTTITGAQTLAGTSWSVFAIGSSGGAGVASGVTMTMPNYRGTTYHKVVNAEEFGPDTTAANIRYRALALRWRSTAAVSRMSVAPGGAFNLKTGSRLSIYGY